MVTAPETDEGWYVLHEFRTVDWDEWRGAPRQERDRAIEEGTAFLQRAEAVEDADAGESGLFSVLGHKADLLVIHFRPTLDEISALERQFETTALGGFTDRASSYLSVTEVSDYVSDEYFASDGDPDAGITQYIEGKLYPEIPNAEYACFYPMDRRRGPEYNWYDLSYEDRADLLSAHGEIGKSYAGDITQVIASSVGFDDHEWGVTLFGADPTHIKDIVYEMRFDEASSRYGEFGDFYVGRRFPPTDLGAYLAGDAVPTVEQEQEQEHEQEAAVEPGVEDPAQTASPSSGERPPQAGAAARGAEATADGDSVEGSSQVHGADAESDPEGAGSIRGDLQDLDIYAGQPHGEDVYATVLYSEADPDALFEEVDGLRSNFDHYGTHVKTAVYSARNRARAAVVSVWDTSDAAETAAGFLSELPGTVERAGEESGFGTMGMFYSIKPEYHDEFMSTFDDVGEILEGMDGHMETDLMINREDENDTFISSQWQSRENAMGFFRSEEFSEAVEWGRDVLTDRPRHVFLA